jgi:phosphoglycolate phosphatase
LVPRFPFYLFDVDGTLVDSAADICGAIQGVLVSANRAAVSHDILKSYIGRTLHDTFSELFPEMDEREREALTLEYRAAYPKRNHAGTTIYPGVPRMLEAVGGRKATATTKGTPTTRIVLEKFGLIDFFDHVQGTDGFPAKPAPDVLLASLAALGAPAEECLFVGDSAADMEAGRRAGVKTCAVLYGYGNREEMARWEPDYWIERPEDLAG